MKVQARFAVAIAVLALVSALSGIGGAYAGTVLIGSKQIRNGSLLTVDYKKGSVQTSDIQNGGVDAPDIGTGEVGSSEIGDGSVGGAEIGEGQVDGGEIDVPDPVETVEPEATAAPVPSEFVLLDPVTTYEKVEAASLLEVTWTGSASAGFSPCQFQVRVDGQAPAPGGGVIYVQNGSIEGNVSVTATFENLPAGPHAVAIFARSIIAGQACTVGPNEAQVAQTFLIAEQVL